MSNKGMPPRPTRVSDFIKAELIIKRGSGLLCGPLLQPSLPCISFLANHFSSTFSDQHKMAEQEPTTEQLAELAASNEEAENPVNYKPPAQKSLQEIQELDKDDESLRKYKETLLGKTNVVASKRPTPSYCLLKRRQMSVSDRKFTDAVI